MWPHRWQPTRLPRPWDSPGENTGVGCHFLLQCREVKSESEIAQSCPTLIDPMDCSLPGSSTHGIFQARVLEWGAIAFSVFYLYHLLNPSISPSLFMSSAVHEWLWNSNFPQAEKERKRAKHFLSSSFISSSNFWSGGNVNLSHKRCSIELFFLKSYLCLMYVPGCSYMLTKAVHSCFKSQCFAPCTTGCWYPWVGSRLQVLTAWIHNIILILWDYPWFFLKRKRLST